MAKRIFVRKVNGMKKDGKTPFTAWETTDTKDKTRLSVSFVQDGQGEPKLEKDVKGVNIELIEAWVDKRKRFPVLRVREYAVLETETTKTDNLDEFVDDDDDE